MKLLHKPNLFCWSTFNEERNLDFHSVFWKGTHANVAIDPLELSAHDRRHIEALGGVQDIIITNSDHLRATAQLQAATGARVWVPARERQSFADLEARGLEDGAEPFPGLRVMELRGSKTEGELCLLIEGDTLVTGDLVRGHRAGQLNLLPDAKLHSKPEALDSLRRLASLQGVEAVLVGDGWPVFRDGARALQLLLDASQGR